MADKRAWSPGLRDRLMAAGFDAGTAELAARHFRADLKPYVEGILAHLDGDGRRVVYLTLYGREPPSPA